MTLTIINNGDGTFTAEFEYTAAQAKISDTLDAAAHQLWVLGYGPTTPETGSQPGSRVPYDQLTNPQKLAMIDQFVRDGVVSLAKNWYIKDQLDQAEIQAITDADGKYI